jgi:hypothetical protein
MKTIFIDKEDYRYERHGSKHYVYVRYPSGERLAGSFSSRDSADGFIRERCEPKEFSAPVFDDICRCGSSIRNWDYVTTDGITYELCRDCKNPLRANIVTDLNKKYLGDFDLDDFLNL